MSLRCQAREKNEETKRGEKVNGLKLQGVKKMENYLSFMTDYNPCPYGDSKKGMEDVRCVRNVCVCPCTYTHTHTFVFVSSIKPQASWGQAHFDPLLRSQDPEKYMLQSRNWMFVELMHFLTLFHKFPLLFKNYSNPSPPPKKKPWSLCSKIPHWMPETVDSAKPCIYFFPYTYIPMVMFNL